jgi:spore maturation protein CgeB
MSSPEDLAKIMRGDWDRRVKHDYRFWMSDGFSSDQHMWQTGSRDFGVLTAGIQYSHDKTFVEVGCGVGRMLRAAAQNFGSVVGVDVSTEAIKKAHEFLSDLANIKLIVGNGYSLAELNDNSVDVVGVFAALSSAPSEILAGYMGEIQRILKPDGILRLQIYTGSEQKVGREDTLHLRCYEENRFRDAAKLAGFDVEYINDLVLGVEVSFESIDVKAKIVSLKKNPLLKPAPVSVITSALLSSPEVNGKSVDGDIEYWMTLNLAETAADSGDYARAKEALNYALSLSKTVTIDVGDVLERIVNKVSEGDNPNNANTSHETNILQTNINIIKAKFPKVYEQILSVLNSDQSEITVKNTQDGVVLFEKDTCFDHAEKPKAAATQWIKRNLAEQRLIDAGEICVIGLSAGYHIEELLNATKKSVSVIEPNINLFLAAIKNRDLSFVFNSIRTLSVGDQINQDAISDEVEILIRPQTQLLSADKISCIKEKFYGIRGLKSLKPNVVVVGPLQGGTLPITGYTTRALLSLGQRTRELDMSPFNSGYMSLQNMLKEPHRLQTMYNNYVECVSQTILEAAIEKKTDIVIFMAQAPVTGRVLQELRNRGIITVLWFMEDYLRFTYWQSMSRFYDFVFTIQKGECLDLIKQAGAGEVHYLPAACDPIVHAPRNLTAEEKQEWGSKYSFVGAGYHNRQQVFASFADLPFKLWGTEWPGCKPFDRMIQKEGQRLTPDEYTKIFCGTDVNINLHSSNERDGVDPFGDFVNPRTFELAACGAFQLVDERSLLSEVFEVGKEVITFSSPQDLREKMAYYADRPEERRAIAEASRKRVLNEHTYAHRIQQMLSIIYSSKYEHLKSRSDAHPWKKMLERAKGEPELADRCQRAFLRGEEPKLDGLIADIMVGQGKLTETEQKLLFLHHVSKQIIRMKMEENSR